MEETGISSAGIKHLKNLQNIRILKFAETTIDDQAADIIKNMRQLQILGATNVKGITDKSIPMYTHLLLMLNKPLNRVLIS